MHLGLAGIPPVAMAVPMALGRGGNGITVSTALYERMLAGDPAAMERPGLGTAAALKKLILSDRAAGRPLLSLASVFPFSCHHYELRRWLLAGGIDPTTEVNLGIIAPPRMAESLGAGWIDGYCVGEPWNTRAVMRGTGRLVATKEDIWPGSHEKVLGLRQTWLAENHGLTLSLIRALTRAAIWADAVENRQALAELLAEPRHLGLPVEIIASALAQPATAPIFHRDGATLPRPEIAREILAEMVAAGQLPHPDPGADAVWRPDIHQAAQ
jgi:ABC-type nitrate/sulfonate/bicarbonate transport system substrate-binding protein